MFLRFFGGIVWTVMWPAVREPIIVRSRIIQAYFSQPRTSVLVGPNSVCYNYSGDCLAKVANECRPS